MRRAILTLLALAVFLPATAIARTQAICSIDRLVRTSCCPPKKATAPASVPTLQRECCQIEKHGATAPPVATEPVHDPVPAPIATIVVAYDAVAPLRVIAIAIAPRAQAPPPERTLLSQHSALLV